MSCSQQQGIVTLLVTSMLAIALLMLSLASYRGLFYQIKQAQNELKARQEHWLAEGGIECAYAYLHSFPERLSSLLEQGNAELNDVCKQELGMSDIYVEALEEESYILHAIGPSSTLRRYFHYREVTGMGAIQSRANLRLIGSFDISSDAPRFTNLDGRYPCVAVQYASHVVYEVGGSYGELKTGFPLINGPFNGFEGECADSHITLLTSNQSSLIEPNNFNQDFVKNVQLDTFKNYFNRENSPENIALLKEQYQVFSLASVADGHDCAEVINDNLTLAQNKLWIEGHCILTSSLTISWPSSLVVENGIFSATGSHEFSGSVYHLVDMSLPDFSPTKIEEYWAELSYISTIEDWLTSGTVYFDNGSFRPKGGMYFDALGGEAVLKGSYDIDYSAANNVAQGRKVFSWLRGGWFAQ